MTQELGGGGSRSKYKVKELGPVVTHDLGARWRWNIKVKTSSKKIGYRGNMTVKNDVEVVV